MLDEVLMVSPRLAVLHTAASKEAWEGLMTSQLTSQPDKAITIIRWRRSQHGGRPWAKPLMCDAQVRGITTTTRERAAGRGSEELCQLRLTLAGPLGSDPNGLCNKLMEEVAKKTAQWRRVPNEENLGPLTYVTTVDAEDKWLGSIVLRCESGQMAAALTTCFDGAAIQVNGARSVLRVFHAESAARGGRCDRYGGAWLPQYRPRRLRAR